MTVQALYEHYRIMEALQLHQLRAAGVVKILADARGDVPDPHTAVLACLFHDMGNILKFDLTIFPDFLEPQGKDYWQKVKDDFRAKYGSEEHEATRTIAREIALPQQTLDLISGMGFSKVHQILAHGSLPLKIVEYADQRVAPYGIASLEERLEDGRRRYLHRAGTDYAVDRAVFDNNAALMKELERALFVGLSITPADITEAGVSRFFEEFRAYEIKE